jgi:hypothetical protein
VNLIAALLTLKLLTVFIEPGDPLSKDDVTLVACVTHALTERPSGIMVVATQDDAAATIRVANDSGVRIHVLGVLDKKDGTRLVSVNHVTHGLNHGLCHQADGLLDEMARKLKEARFK